MRPGNVVKYKGRYFVVVAIRPQIVLRDDEDNELTVHDPYNIEEL